MGTAWEFSDKIGLTDGRYNAATAEFLRGDVAMISAAALSVKLKGSNVMLLQKLYNQMSAEKWAAAAKTRQISKYGLPAALGKTALTYQTAYALVGKDPAVIASSVKTAFLLFDYFFLFHFLSFYDLF